MERDRLRLEALAEIYHERLLEQKTLSNETKQGWFAVENFVEVPTDNDLPHVVVKKLLVLELEQQESLNSLPPYVQKLVSGFRVTVVWFEIFE